MLSYDSLKLIEWFMYLPLKRDEMDRLGARYHLGGTKTLTLAEITDYSLIK